MPTRDAGKPDKAIKHYRKAWEHANSALKHAKKKHAKKKHAKKEKSDDD